MASHQINFGILGCAEIARKIHRAITLSPNATLCAIGSRTYEKAAKFARENESPAAAKVYGSYDAVLEDPEVDAVYVPLPTSLHVKWAVLAAQKKKHVLLEKPAALNVGELDAILEACESNGVQFMDATMWMHHPRTAKMEEFLLDSSQFGELKYAHSCFTFAADKNFLENDIRVKPDLDGLGALGDAGWYCIRSILWAARFTLPESVVALPGTELNSSGVIMACGAALRWADGKTATFHCSFLAHLTMDLAAVGTHGTLRVHDFIIPFEEGRASFTAAVRSGLTERADGWGPRPGSRTVEAVVAQEAAMVGEFGRLVAGIKYGGGRPERWWGEVSRKTQVVVDAVKASIEGGGVTVEVGG